MKIAVVGATGLLGQHTLRAAREAGHEVIGMARVPAVPMLPGLDDVPMTSGDAWQLPGAELSEWLTGCDALVYALGPDERRTPPGPAGPYYQRYLVEGTAHVVSAAAHDAGVGRIVVLGSYFSTWHRTHPDLGIGMRHPYIRARLAQAHRAISIGTAAGAQVNVLEIPYVFGSIPHQTPIWDALLLRWLHTVPVVAYPSGGSSIVTAAQVGQAAVGALERGTHGARYPLADLDLHWHRLLRLLLDALGRPGVPIVSLPRPAAEAGLWPVRARRRRHGREGGLDLSWLLRDIMYAYLYVDASVSQRVLRYRPGGVPDAIVDTVQAADLRNRRT